MCANDNKHDLSEPLWWIVCLNDAYIMFYNKKFIILSQWCNDYLIKSYSDSINEGLLSFSLDIKVIVHHELLERRKALKLLWAPFFPIYENQSKRTGGKGSTYLIKRSRKQLVIADYFCFSHNKFSITFEAIWRFSQTSNDWWHQKVSLFCMMLN